MPTKSSALTDVGRRRSHNEDSFFISDELELFLVADGMGGHAAGEIASHTAVIAISDFVRRAMADRDMTWPFGVDDTLSEVENIVLSAIKLANQRICQMAAEKSSLTGMGTTIAGVKIDDGKATVFHVGDSRVYRLRDGKIMQLTADHSWVNEQLQRRMITEEEARNHRWRHVITRALGNKASIDVDLKTVQVQDGDLLLICTDGLSGLVSDESIVKTLVDHDGDLGEACKALIGQANQAGGHDNVTVVIVQYTD